MSLEDLLRLISARDAAVEGRAVADALWLMLMKAPPQADALEPPVQPSRPSSEEGSLPPSEADTDHQPGEDGPQPLQHTVPRDDEVAPPRPEQGQAQLHPPISGSRATNRGGAAALMIPSVGALPNAPAIARALRPLRRRVWSRYQTGLDEQATAHRSAEARHLVPVLRFVRSRWLILHVVVDQGGMTLIWRDAIDAFRRLLLHQGAFRDIRTWRFDSQAADEKLALFAGPTSDMPRRAGELCDVEGRHLVMVVSDCVGGAWHDGRTARTLRLWGRSGLVVVLQVMPPHLWHRTALGREADVHLRSPAIGAPNAQLRAVPLDAWDENLPANSALTPVVTLSAETLGAWARMLSGVAGETIPGYALDPAMKPLVRCASPDLAPDAEQRVQRFLSLSTPTAQHLALLAAAAPVTLPILNLVRATFLPTAEQSHLAEVLLGGLLRRASPAEVRDPDAVLYEFYPGVEEHLLRLAPLDQSLDVAAHVSRYLEERGEREHKMRTVLALPREESKSELPEVRHFAHIRATLLRGMGYNDLADRIESRHEGSTTAMGDALISIMEAAGKDVWAAAKQRLTHSIGLERDSDQHQAFERALNDAQCTLRSAGHDSAIVEQMFLLLSDTSPEVRTFTAMALEELLFRATPDLGRLLDYYRRQLRFTTLLHQKSLPDWNALAPALCDFLGRALPAALRDSPLRSLLLAQAEFQALDEASPIRAAQGSATTPRRIEALLADMLAPRGAVPITPDNLNALYQSYGSFIEKSFGTLDFRGIMQVQNAVCLCREEVYVPLRATLDARSFHHAGQSVSLHTFVRDQPFLVVLGGPGTGKSTLVCMIMLALAAGCAGTFLGLHDERLPIFFPVAAFAEVRRDPGGRDLAPLDYLRAFYHSRSLPDFVQLFERALLSGRVLVLFDGLDEVHDPGERLALVRCLEDFVHTWDLPGNRFLATSRIAGYDEAPLDASLFVTTQVQPFDDAAIRLFAQKWSAAYEQIGWNGSADDLARKAAAHAQALTSAIFANPQVAELAQNPLFLTMLAFIRHQGVTLPDRRVALYELCIKMLTETWNRARSLSMRPIDVYLQRARQRLDEGFVVNLLGLTALWIHREKPGGLVEQDALERHLASTFRELYNVAKGEASDIARDFLTLVEEQTGLLQARGKGLYGFLHLTLEEYLAARALLDLRAEQAGLLQTYATDANWREVLRLCVASIREVRGTQQALSEILATPATAETRGKPIVLAGECLLDVGRNGTTAQAHRQVLDALLATLADAEVPIPTRIAAGDVLGQLGDPRLLDVVSGEAAGLDTYAHVEPYWCAIDAGPFWFGDDRVERSRPGKNADQSQPLRFDAQRLTRVDLRYSFKIARYPVTNAEFRRFLDANGPDGYDAAHPWWTDEGRRFLAPGGHRWDDQAAWIRAPRRWEDTNYNRPAQPIVGISWYEAAAYCRWLTSEGHATGWLPPDQIIRLPTALEWERAARHTDTRPYPWGDAPITPNHANYAESGVGAPSPVGCFPAGRTYCGADDLLGNVLEWLATLHGADDDPQPREDFTPDSGVCLSFTYFGDNVARMCCGARDWYNPFNRGGDWSFRILESQALVG